MHGEEMKTDETRAYILAYLHEAEKRDLDIWYSTILSKIMNKATIKETSARGHLQECEKMGYLTISTTKVQLTEKGRRETERIQYVTTEEI